MKDGGVRLHALRHSYWTRQMWGEASMLHTGWDLGQSLSFMQYTTLAGCTDTCRGYAHHGFVVRQGTRYHSVHLRHLGRPAALQRVIEHLNGLRVAKARAGITGTTVL